MRLTEVSTTEELTEFMTEPSEGLVEMMGRLSGDLMVLGGSGKMGPELVEMIVRADRAAGRTRRVLVPALFPGERGAQVAARFRSLGVEVWDGDLTQEAFLKSLPQTENLIYMVGFKFGTAEDPGRTIQMNCVLPAQVGMAFPESRIVVFSSGNPYDYTPLEYGGSREEDEFVPHGLYGWSIVGREMAFRATASGNRRQRIALYRLMYAQHLCYGVIVDLAKMILSGETISLAMPYVNLLSQRDANDRAIRALEIAANPPRPLNVSGPAVSVRWLAEQLGEHLGRAPRLADDEGTVARLANDDFCVQRFGPYRDSVDEMIAAAARWVARGGEDWNLPTMFGNLQSQY